jgi:hypothetical protein
VIQQAEFLWIAVVRQLLCGGWIFGSSTLDVLDPKLLLGLHILRDILYRNTDM